MMMMILEKHFTLDYHDNMIITILSHSHICICLDEFLTQNWNEKEKLCKAKQKNNHHPSNDVIHLMPILHDSCYSCINVSRTK